jgi:hypothetical protein
VKVEFGGGDAFRQSGELDVVHVVIFAIDEKPRRDRAIMEAPEHHCEPMTLPPGLHGPPGSEMVADIDMRLDH